jgi:hypothetical protein
VLNHEGVAMKDGDVIELGELNVLVKVLMRNEAPSLAVLRKGTFFGRSRQRNI